MITAHSALDLPITTSIFPGGEVHVRLGRMYSGSVRIRADLHSSDDIMRLLMITDAIRREDNHAKIIVDCPYLPYARQDRVCAPGEANSLRVMCDIINAQNYDQFIVWDVHSHVATGLLNRCINVPASHFTRGVVNQNMVLVAPDAGAAQRVSQCAKQSGARMIEASKKRDPATGDISGTVVHSGNLGNASVMIVDDICDGGRTFTALATELRNITSGSICLYVTHGIFSHGLRVFNGLIDRIYVANPFPGVDMNNPLIKKVSP